MRFKRGDSMAADSGQQPTRFAVCFLVEAAEPDAPSYRGIQDGYDLMTSDGVRVTEMTQGLTGLRVLRAEVHPDPAAVFPDPA
jgi:hypothetical protein